MCHRKRWKGPRKAFWVILGVSVFMYLNSPSERRTEK